MCSNFHFSYIWNWWYFNVPQAKLTAYGWCHPLCPTVHFCSEILVCRCSFPTCFSEQRSASCEWIALCHCPLPSPVPFAVKSVQIFPFPHLKFPRDLETAFSSVAPLRKLSQWKCCTCSSHVLLFVTGILSTPRLSSWISFVTVAFWVGTFGFGERFPMCAVAASFFWDFKAVVEHKGVMGVPAAAGSGGICLGDSMYKGFGIFTRTVIRVSLSCYRYSGHIKAALSGCFPPCFLLELYWFS